MTTSTRRRAGTLAGIVVATAGLLAGSALAASAQGFRAFTGPLHQVTTLASTVPGNGDVNPYGVAVVPRRARAPRSSRSRRPGTCRSSPGSARTWPAAPAGWA